jgi:predicted restriction endonuclease
MGNIACSLAWVPAKFGGFHKPCDLSLDDLHDDFIKNLTLAKHLGMKLTSGDEMMKKLNEQYKQVLGNKELTREYIDFAIRHREVVEKLMKQGLISDSEFDGNVEPEKTTESFESIDFVKALTETFSCSDSSDLDFDDIPLNQIINPELYIKRVRKLVSENKANEPPLNERFKKVPTKKWEAKNNEIRIFLQEEYKGKCQICSYTFSKRDRQPYFEGLYLVSKTRARWIDDRGNVLCLCANCCAKFKQGSVEAGNVLKQIGEAVEKANPTLTIRLCGEEVSIHFTRKHMIHLQALLTDSSTAVSC